MADISIKVLMDNKSNRSDMAVEHGLSLWVEGFEKKILFDAGQSDKLFKNAKQMGTDIWNADAIAISHGHYDHAGGVDKLLGEEFKGEIYVHPGAGKTRYSRHSCEVKAVGISKDCFELVKFYDKRDQVVWTTLPVFITAQIALTGQIPRECEFEDTGGDFFYDMNCFDEDSIIDEQAMVVETQKGLVVLFGCAHAGVINTLSYIERLFQQKKIYGIFGGLHLKKASSHRLEKTIEEIKNYDVQIIGTNHCTGDRAQSRFKDEFGDKVVDFSCGAEVRI